MLSGDHFGSQCLKERKEIYFSLIIKVLLREISVIKVIQFGNVAKVRLNNIEPWRIVKVQVGEYSQELVAGCGVGWSRRACMSRMCCSFRFISWASESMRARVSSSSLWGRRRIEQRQCFFIQNKCTLGHNLTYCFYFF